MLHPNRFVRPCVFVFPRLLSVMLRISGVTAGHFSSVLNCEPTEPRLWIIAKVKCGNSEVEHMTGNTAEGVQSSARSGCCVRLLCPGPTSAGKRSLQSKHEARDSLNQTEIICRSWYDFISCWWTSLLLRCIWFMFSDFGHALSSDLSFPR